MVSISFKSSLKQQSSETGGGLKVNRAGDRGSGWYRQKEHLKMKV